MSYETICWSIKCMGKWPSMPWSVFYVYLGAHCRKLSKVNLAFCIPVYWDLLRSWPPPLPPPPPSPPLPLPLPPPPRHLPMSMPTITLQHHAHTRCHIDGHDHDHMFCCWDTSNSCYACYPFIFIGQLVHGRDLILFVNRLFWLV